MLWTWLDALGSSSLVVKGGFGIFTALGLVMVYGQTSLGHSYSLDLQMLGKPQSWPSLQTLFGVCTTTVADRTCEGPSASIQLL